MTITEDSFFEASSQPSLKTIVDELQAQVRNLVADHSSRIVELETEVRQLVANQVRSEAKIRQLTANQNTNGTNSGTTTTTHNGNDDDDDAPNRNNETTDVFPLETIVREETTPLSSKANSSIQRIGNRSLNDLVETKHNTLDEEEIFSFSRNSISNNTDTMMNISAASPSKDDDNEKDDGVKSKLFIKSSYRYLFMDTITYPDGNIVKLGWNHRMLASSVMAFQFIAYGFLAKLIVHEEKVQREALTSPTLEIDSKYCFDTAQYDTDIYGDYSLYDAFVNGDGYSNLAQASIGPESLSDLIQCSNPTDLWHSGEDVMFFVVLVYTGFLVLTSYTLSDLYELFILFKCRGWKAKLVSILILTMTVLATSVGCLGTTIASGAGLLNTFLLFVGVVFVHEVDEQLEYILHTHEALKEKYCCLSLQFSIFYAVVFIPLLYLTLCLSLSNLLPEFSPDALGDYFIDLKIM